VHPVAIAKQPCEFLLLILIVLLIFPDLDALGEDHERDHDQEQESYPQNPIFTRQDRRSS
jgi:hypothetical protein